MQSVLTEALQLNQLVLSDTMQQQMLGYLALLTQWNRVYNLTTITAARDMVYLHLIDSLQVLPWLQGERILDVGTGAGLPGIPLAITNPDRHIVLLDKNNKKTRFLTQVIAELGIANAEVVQSRAQQFHPSQGFDTILSRAFGSLADFVTDTRHLLHPDGVWLAMKGRMPEAELSALPANIGVRDVRQLGMKGMQLERCLISLFLNQKRASWEK